MITQEQIEKLNDLVNKVLSWNLVGADHNGNIVGCSGYHENADEYEYYQFAQLGTEEDAKDVYDVITLLPILMNEYDRLREALEFYADESRYTHHEDEAFTPIEIDDGQIAYHALKGDLK